jgi:hypothetical protein
MAEPIPARPLIPAGYGVSADASGAELLPWSWAAERLARARNYWLCTARVDGRPHAMPVWAVWLEEALWFSTGRESEKGRNLARDARCVIHLESGDEVVVLDGEAVEDRDSSRFERFADAYEAKYAYRVTPELGAVFAFKPHSAYTWREVDFPKSAVRWLFESRPISEG